MEQYNISLKNVISHGNITTDFTDNMLHIITHSQNTRFYAFEMPLSSYIQLPQKVKIPLRIDLRIKMDNPSLYLSLGKGHLTFGINFLDNRRIGDIAEPDIKKTSVFDNKLEVNKFHDLSIIYDYKFMRILVNGKERFYSKKEKYIKSHFLEELNKNGFDFKIAGSKQTHLTIASISIIEYENDELKDLRSGQNTVFTADLSIDKKVKADFDECISKLPLELNDKVKEINNYLLNNKNLKIKRKIEGTSKACKISYVSTHGFSYSIHISDDILDHFFWWYMVSNNRYENKYMGQKNDLTELTLNKVKETSPETAEELFSYYDECVSCNPNCSVTRKIYKYADKKKAVCHGKMIMNMNVNTFNNIRFMFVALDELLK